MNCKVFRSAPLAFALMAHPADTDVLRDVETYLNTRGVSFASLVIDALRDPESSLTGDLIARITDILDALCPKLNISSVLNACGVSLSSRYFSPSFFARFHNLVTHTLVHHLHFFPCYPVFHLAFIVIDLLFD